MTKQFLNITGNPNGGTFLLYLDTAPTAKIGYHPSAAQLKSALAALPNVGTGNVTVTKPGNWDYDIVFADALGAVSPLVPDYSALKPAGATVVVTAGGSPTQGTSLADQLAAQEEANAEAAAGLMDQQLAATRDKRMAMGGIPPEKRPL